MSHDSLSERRQALEDRFFKDQEANKISRMREQLASKKKIEELREVSGIDKENVLTALVSLNVGAADLHALSLVPLVTVAWADGTVTESERAAVLKAAHDQGVTEGSHGHELLDAWLTSKPADDLFESWQAYASSLAEMMSDNDATALHDSILGLAHDVASAAGGILGLGSVSSAEKAVLQAIADAFGK